MRFEEEREKKRKGTGLPAQFPSETAYTHLRGEKKVKKAETLSSETKGGKGERVWLAWSYTLSTYPKRSSFLKHNAQLAWERGGQKKKVDARSP